MRRFGLIGKSLEHSFSARYFNRKFTEENLHSCRYDLFPLQSPEAMRTLAAEMKELTGLNVTIPFKTTIIPYLEELDDIAGETGAVNTIRIFRNKGGICLKGYNTDVWGFEQTAGPFFIKKNVLVLGTGGAARAVIQVLRKRNVNYLMVSRTPSSPGEIGYDQITQDMLRNYLFIVNATPVGMYPHTDELPELDYRHITKSHVLYDLIYNPPVTGFLLKGKQQGATTMNGLKMLMLQAEKSWEIWNMDE
jgi:shikimate dehydrogenase